MLKIKPTQYLQQFAKTPQLRQTIFNNQLTTTHSQFSGLTQTHKTLLWLILAAGTLVYTQYREGQQSDGLQKANRESTELYANKGLTASPNQIKWTGLFSYYKGSIPITSDTRKLVEQSKVSDLVKGWRVYKGIPDPAKNWRQLPHYIRTYAKVN